METGCKPPPVHTRSDLPPPVLPMHPTASSHPHPHVRFSAQYLASAPGNKLRGSVSITSAVIGLSMAEGSEPSSPRDQTGGRGIPGSAMAAPRQNASPPSLSHGCIGPEREPWPPRVVHPLREVLPPSRSTGVTTPESGTIAALDHVNHADEDGRCSTSYSPLSTVAPEAATCDIDLPPPHVTEDQEYYQEYDTTNMTRERGQEDDVIDSGHGADGEEIQKVWSLPGSSRLSLTTISVCMCIVHCHAKS